MFKKMEINIPFAKALAQMPHYAKFMQDIISKKRKLDEGGVVNLSTTCSAIIQKNMSHKMQDLRSFTIPCTIGNHEFGKALCDSGESINMMPLSIVKRLSFGGVNSHYNLSTYGRKINDPTIRNPGRCASQGGKVHFPS